MLDLTPTLMDAKSFVVDIDRLDLIEGLHMWHVKSGIPFSDEQKKRLTDASNSDKLHKIVYASEYWYGKVIYLGSEHLYYITKENW